MTSTEEYSTQHFKLVLLNLYSSLYLAANTNSNHAWHSIKGEMGIFLGATRSREAAWHMARDITGEIVQDILHIILRDIVSTSVRGHAIYVVRDVTMKSVRDITKLKLSVEKRIEEICKSIIKDKKEIEFALEQKISRETHGEVLTKEKKVKIIRRLMNYSEEEMKRVKKIIPLQLHNICYDIEKLIKLHGGLEEKILLEEFHTFLQQVGVEDSYYRIFHNNTTGSDDNNTSKYLLSQRLPKVLTNIIVKYTELSVTDKEDDDQIFSRMCMEL